MDVHARALLGYFCHLHGLGGIVTLNDFFLSCLYHGKALTLQYMRVQIPFESLSESRFIRSNPVRFYAAVIVECRQLTVITSPSDDEPE